MTSYLFPEGWARRLLWSSCKWHSKDWPAACSAAVSPGAVGCHPHDMPGNPSSSLNCPVTAASPSCCTSSLSLAWVHAPRPRALLFFAEDCIFIFNTVLHISGTEGFSGNLGFWHRRGWLGIVSQMCVHVVRAELRVKVTYTAVQMGFSFSGFEEPWPSSSEHQLWSLYFLFCIHPVRSSSGESSACHEAWVCLGSFASCHLPGLVNPGCSWLGVTAAHSHQLQPDIMTRAGVTWCQHRNCRLARFLLWHYKFPQGSPQLSPFTW